MLKSLYLFETIDPGDNAYVSNILGKYENHPDSLDQLCLADFGFMYNCAGKSQEEKEETGRKRHD